MLSLEQQEQQKEWVRNAGIKIGDRVRVIAEAGTGGWENVWSSEMYVGAEGKVQAIDNFGVVLRHKHPGCEHVMTEHYYPFWVLVKITDED